MGVAARRLEVLVMKGGSPPPVSPQETRTGRSLGDFDAYAKGYDATVNAAIDLPGLSVDFFTRAKVDYIERLLTRSFPGRSNLRILDVGCGVGNYHPQLGREERHITGIEVSAESISLASAHNPGVDYRLYDGTDIPCETSTFDFAFAVCVYHHVPLQQRSALTREVLRVLKPGGILAIFEHNPKNPLTMRVVNRCPFDADAILLNSRDTETLMIGAGFTSVATDFILTVPLRGRYGQLFDRLFAHLPLGSQYMTVGRRAAETR